jgi:hypothetical protein
MLDITRNQFFYAGLVCLLLGAQFRFVEAVELNAEFSQLLYKQGAPPIAAMNSASQGFAGSGAPVVKKTLRPPEWLGWSLLSVGGVLVLHSWAMKKQGEG